MPGPHRSIDIAGDGAPKTLQNGRGRGLQGERDRESTMADQPPDDGRGNRRPPPSNADGQLVDVAGGWARKTANGRQSLGLRRHGAPVKTQTWSATEGRDRQPAPKESTGDPMTAVGRGRTIGRNLSALLVPYRSRLKWPHLHCRADTVA